MFFKEVLVQCLISASLFGPLVWYFLSRWRTICSGYTFFFVLCESVVLIIGSINMHVLINGTMRNFEKSKPIDDTLILDSEKIWYFMCVNKNLPPILIVIPTYKEGIRVLERTLMAVDRIEYPKHLLMVVIGDDGKNDDTRRLISEKFPHMRYHRRKNISGHAKAGNINDILFLRDEEVSYHYRGDYVLILDCDMAPLPGILSSLLPLFYNQEFEREEKCCFVQSPQQFCNIRGIDFLGQNYSFFYKVVLRAYNGYPHGVPCCGTNVLFDRSLLMKIGGLQFGSITEDFKTSLLLHSEGLHSKYYPETTAIGFAPTTLVDFYHQRERWSIGGLQIVFDKSYWKQFIRLPIVYKWIYTFSGLSPIISLFMMILILGPIMDLLDKNIFLCGMSNSVYLSRFIPYTIVYISYLLILHRGLSWPLFILSLQESIFMIPLNIRFLIVYLGKLMGFNKLSFKITPKTTKINHSSDYMISTLFLLFPYFLYFAFTGFSVWSAIQKNKFIQVDVGWLIFIGIQFLNPIIFVLQGLFLSFW